MWDTKELITISSKTNTSKIWIGLEKTESGEFPLSIHKRRIIIGNVEKKNKKHSNYILSGCVVFTAQSRKKLRARVHFN